jgi:hypothetical protein
MHEKCIVAEFQDSEKARLGLQILAKAGFDPTQVSFIARRDDPALAELGKLEKDAAEGLRTTSGAGLGALLGGAVSAPVAVSTLLGPIILVGPLVGMGLGAAIGGLLAGTHKWDENPDAGQHYQRAIEQGGILVIVSGTKGELLEAEASLKTAGPVAVKHFAMPESQA